MIAAYDGLLLLFSSFWAVPLGLFVGIFIGAIPGLSSSGMLAVLLPVLVSFPPEVGLVFAISLYAGGEVGNAFPAIILNIPGDAAGVITASEGHPRMRNGTGAQALGMAVMGAMLGAMFAGAMSILFAPI